MKILLVTTDFPNPYNRTNAVFNLHLAQALARRHEVRVIAPIPWVEEWLAQRRGEPALSAERRRVAGGVEVYHPRYYYPPRVLRTRYASFYWWSVRRTVKRLLEGFCPDVVLGYWAHPDGEVAARVARLAGAAAGAAGAARRSRPRSPPPRRRRCVQKALRAADAVLTVNQDLKTRTVELGVAPENVHVWRQGVDTALFSPGDRVEARRRLGLPADRRALLWVGRMVPVKGLDVLLSACAGLRKSGPPFHLYLVGEGPLRKTLEADCAALGLSNVVSFVGPRLHDELPDWYRAADLTVLPSRSEGLPNVLRESLACGTPFVASRVGGIPEIAEEPWGRLVPPEQPEALAASIAQALTEGTTAPSRSCGWDESAEALVDVFGPLMGRRREEAHAPRPSAWSPRQLLRRALTALLPRRRFLTRGPAESGSVCLTFDDGPHPEHTPRLLDGLRRQGVRATFFVVGRQAERYPELVRRIAAEGHTLGHHSYSHSEPGQTSARQLLDEVRRTRDLLAGLTGTPPVLFRPPKGSLTARKLWGLWRAGQTVVLWNVDPKDYARRAAGEVRDWFRRRPLNGGDLVLMHDNHPHAAEVVPGLVEDAHGRGLTFSQLPEWTQ
jgi:peptidoglycan/xylan/chitin deacetylase (PgdA/CDA1 family)/glycosyltransferase involved in cell wall biosynthesis